MKKAPEGGSRDLLYFESKSREVVVSFDSAFGGFLGLLLDHLGPHAALWPGHVVNLVGGEVEMLAQDVVGPLAVVLQGCVAEV